MDLGSFNNAILKNLDAETIARLHLHKVRLELRHPLEVPDEPVRDIFFLESGIASVTTRFKDGFEVEAGMYGNDSLTGISAFMGARRSLNASYIQIAGHGFSCKFEQASEEFDRDGNSVPLLCVQFRLSLYSPCKVPAATLITTWSRGLLGGYCWSPIGPKQIDLLYPMSSSRRCSGRVARRLVLQRQI
jgi:hypothetical protein